ncbi:PREDICTED: NADH dehydrogenase [ubiquinone] 1 beta subcomplex subunit 7 [Vollenhovia emeryi]|uniref:NADH dehydrogenase [ubiquinone] 1 beta subcomplex subunit 7 n=1 Tax=Vollenhovia emeryi TaxID=411798 RepID=UPI0005F3A6FC|nr:PREDICTED: NADH dehydrogenase [ubiquinone] 1 beta subcomplex subunit 7 [Vollenhovia emeryi]
MDRIDVSATRRCAHGSLSAARPAGHDLRETMGNWIATYITHPDTMPVPDGKPTFDPMFGFPNGRKPRVIPYSEEDMMAFKIPLDRRDYCAHKYMDLHECKRRHYPFMIKCAHERHEYNRCHVEDYTMRLKEYERERRLLERQKRIQQAATA